MAGPNVDFRITGDDKLLKRALERSEREVDKLKGKLRETGRTSKAAFDTGISSMARYAMGMVSLGSAVSATNRAWQVWLQNIREASSEVREASHDIIAFAALQEGGTKAARVREAGALAVQYGVTDRGVAYDVVQALQSALGSWEKGMKAAESVFAGRLVGVPIELGKELEVQAVAQGVPSGVFLRQAFIAGQESARDPRILAGGVRGLLEFQDKTFGMAAAGVLAGPYAERLEVYLRQAAIALQKGTNKQVNKLFRKLGVGEATREERLMALYEAGYRTTEDLVGAGFTELRQRQAISVLLQNIPTLQRVRTKIEERDRPGLLVRERMAVEKELPFERVSREIDVLSAELEEIQAMGAYGREAQRTLREQKIRALAFRRMGVEQAGPFDVISEEGISTEWDVAQFLAAAFAGYRPKGGFRPLPEEFRVDQPDRGILKGVHSSTMAAWEALQYEMHLVREELRENTEALRASAESTKDAVRDGVREGSGNTTLAHPDQEPP